MRKLIAIVALAVIVSGAGLWLAGEWRQFEQRPVTVDGPVNLWLGPGTSFAGMVQQLERLGLTRAGWRWRVLGRLRQPTLQAGEYLIEPGMTIEALLARLAKGEVRRHRFTIVEGWTVARLRYELARDPRIRNPGRDLDDAGLMARLDCPGCSAEGRFLPETYFFIRGTSDLELLERAHTAMNDALEGAWQERADDLPLDGPQELLVLASIVERETGQSGERARVAGVFVRRLERGMRLQTDPTVIYGLDETFDGRLRYIHLRTDHPWNTYTRHGLPPTPIALPGRAALQAAANPEEGTALYFVARGDGGHHFSDTLAEHNAAVDRYIRGKRP